MRNCLSAAPAPAEVSQKNDGPAFPVKWKRGAVLILQAEIALRVAKMIWKEMYDFSPDSVLLCLCSEIYDPNEYIYDYNEFLKEVRYR